MSPATFNLLHDSFWEALCDATQMLERRGIEYALVGGAAVQAWNAYLLTHRQGLSLGDHPVLPLRLRSTRDLDFSTLSSPEAMLGCLNELAATSRPPVQVLSPRAVRLRQVLVNLTLDPQDVRGFQESYRDILDTATWVDLRRGGERLHLRVEALEYLLMTKLTRRGNQAKDMLDMDALCSSLIESAQSVSTARLVSLLEDEPGRHLLDSYRTRYAEAFA